ncbi:MAG: esterase/lipase family protein [Pirellula sp.]
MLLPSRKVFRPWSLSLLRAVATVGYFGLGMSASQGQSPSDGGTPRWLADWVECREAIRDALQPLRQPETSILFLREHPAVQGDAVRFEHLPERLVLVVGGLQSRPETSAVFAKSLQQRSEQTADIAYAVLDYPNDGPLQASGAALRSLLLQLEDTAPQTQVTLVTHSMGGLVARCALEWNADPAERRPAKVDRLVMICPPNHGSVLAKYADAMEITDLAERLQRDGLNWETLMATLVHDGMGEACDDLIPNSQFLHRLNAAPRAEGVRYSIAFGTGGPIDPMHRAVSTLVWEGLRENVERKSGDAAWLAKRLQELMHCDELTRGRGDGAVACRSANLLGVHEKAGFRIHHLQWAEAAEPEVQRMIDWVVQRALR